MQEMTNSLYQAQERCGIRWTTGHPLGVCPCLSIPECPAGLGRTNFQSYIILAL